MRATPLFVGWTRQPINEVAIEESATTKLLHFFWCSIVAHAVVNSPESKGSKVISSAVSQVRTYCEQSEFADERQKITAEQVNLREVAEREFKNNEISKTTYKIAIASAGWSNFSSATMTAQELNIFAMSAPSKNVDLNRACELLVDSIGLMAQLDPSNPKPWLRIQKECRILDSGDDLVGKSLWIEGSNPFDEIWNVAIAGLVDDNRNGVFGLGGMTRNWQDAH